MYFVGADNKYYNNNAYNSSYFKVMIRPKCLQKYQKLAIFSIYHKVILHISAWNEADSVEKEKDTHVNFTQSWVIRSIFFLKSWKVSLRSI